MKYRKWTAVFLTLCLLTGSLSVSAYAENREETEAQDVIAIEPENVEKNVSFADTSARDAEAPYEGVEDIPEAEGVYADTLTPCDDIDDEPDFIEETEEQVGSVEPVSYVNSKGAEQPAVTDYTLVTENTLEWQNGWYVAEGEVTLSGRVTTLGDDVNIILCNNARIDSTDGITVDPGSKLTIWAQTEKYYDEVNQVSCGALFIDCSGHSGDEGYSGIGGKSGPAGEIIINGGDIYAIGEGGSAGIGGGNSDEPYASGTNIITINGGYVYAQGGDSAAGIGGGNGGKAGTITINGGQVSATGGVLAAGIGSSAFTTGGSITINGGDVSTGYTTDKTTGIGSGLYGINPEATEIYLDYDDELSTRIYARSFNGTITIRKPFKEYYEETIVSNNANDLALKTLIPAPLKTYRITAEESDLYWIEFGTTYSPRNGINKSFAGERVVLKTDVKYGYNVEKYIVLDDEGQEIPVMPEEKYGGYFIMPESNVRVSMELSLNEIPYINASGQPMEPLREYTPVDGYDTEWDNGWYVLLDDRDIYENLVITGDDVNLVLCDGATLTATQGITVNEGTSFTVWGQSEGKNPGRILAYNDNGRMNGAGIGGNGGTAGTITINGGSIEAYGDYGSAGIGGCAALDEEAAYGAGTVNINGGYVYAVGGSCTDGDLSIGGAGIGTGYHADASDRGVINIRGGVVNAEGGAYAAGIGGSSDSAGPDIIIRGGDVKARGIGSGKNSEDTTQITFDYPSVLPSVTICSDYYQENDTVTLKKKFMDPEDGTVFEAADLLEDNTVLNGRILIPVDFSEGASFMMNSLIVSGDIGVNFFADLSGLTEEEREETYVIFTVGDSGQEIRVDYDPEFLNQTGEYYGFTCHVSSIQMAENIHAVLHYTINNENFEADTTSSVQQYIEEGFVQNVFTDELGAFVTAMKDYCYYAQIYLSEANGWTIGEEYKEVSEPSVTSYNVDEIKDLIASYQYSGSFIKSDIAKATCSLVLDTTTTMNLNIRPAEGYKGSMTCTVNDKKVPAALRQDGRYRIKIPDISVTKLGDSYHVVLDTDGGASLIDISVMALANICLNNSTGEAQTNLYCALYKYYEAAANLR